MRHAYGVVVAIALSACVVEESYSPSTDPLTRKIFEQLLAGEGIKFTVDARGLYHSSLPWNHDRMIELGDRANAKTARAIGLYSAGDCPDKKLRTYLDANGIIYVEYPQEGRMLFHMTAEDGARFNLVGNQASFKSQCDDARVRSPHA